MITAYALEYKMRFIFEKRTETYKWYVERASKKKIVYCAKNVCQGQALPDLERRGA